jgi:aryl-alcohol dehydrogenase-like predicted oxidoreductase
MLSRREFFAAPAAMTLALRQKADAAAAGPGEWRNKQSGMAYRRLGRTGFMVSEMAMGGNQISPDNYEHVLAALDMGLNYLDTASQYGNGEGERGYAKVIQARPRDSFFLNTKVSLWDGNRTALYKKIYDSLPASEQKKLAHQVEDELARRGVLERDNIGMYHDGQPPQVRAAELANLMAKKYGDRIDRRKQYYQLILDSIDASLTRLGTDHLDVMTCPHGASTPHEVLGHPEIFEAFEKLKQAGKVRHLSVSAHNDPAGVLTGAVESGVYSMAMVAYNIVNHRFVDAALEKAKQADFGVVAMKAARALYDDGKTFPDRTPLIEKAVPGPLNVPQKAFLWNLRNPNLSAVVANMINLDQVKQDMPLAGSKT